MLLVGVCLGVALTIVGVYLAYAGMKSTSTNEYCESCHVHPQAITSWKQGNHYKNKSGVVTNCIDCHLPPHGMDHIVEKGKAGLRDVYAFYFKDLSQIDWDAVSALDNAVHYTFDSACSRCHQELFPIELTEKGVDAHIHYRKHLEELRCVNCHLKTGHYHEQPDETYFVLEEEAPPEEEMAPLITEIPAGSFLDYSEVIPGTTVRFEMLAVQGGGFRMGSPATEPDREIDEGPQVDVQVSPFWIGKFEVSWREFDAFYAETVTRGKNELGEMTDAITGPTPPYGSPDQGWGKGSRPAITMTPYAARKYCEWLSSVTGRKYSLPTEAEWEYALRAGNTGPFPAEVAVPVSWFGEWKKKLFGGALVDEEVLGGYAWYQANSGMKTHPARGNKPNPWGIHNLRGNVWEFCSDWYDPEIYRQYAVKEGMLDPTGPPNGEEHVIRGGSFKSEEHDLRAAARAHTQHDAWLRTDPQIPKSVWWYSDCNDVGFRIVRGKAE